MLTGKIKDLMVVNHHLALLPVIYYTANNFLAAKELLHYIFLVTKKLYRLSVGFQLPFQYTGTIIRTRIITSAFSINPVSRWHNN